MTSVSVEEAGGAWVVRVSGADGRVQTFTCSTEDMARSLAASLRRATGGRTPLLSKERRGARQG